MFKQKVLQTARLATGQQNYGHQNMIRNTGLESTRRLCLEIGVNGRS